MSEGILGFPLRSCGQLNCERPENVNFAAADPEKENEAHQFATANTFTVGQEKEILENPQLTEQNIIRYAKKFNTHPAMIIGRLQYKKLIPYSVGRQFMEPIDLNTVGFRPYPPKH